MEGELRKETPEEYFLRLDKAIENFKTGNVIIFKETDHLTSVDIVKLTLVQNAIQFFQSCQIDLSSFKFDRDEAIER